MGKMVVSAIGGAYFPCKPVQQAGTADEGDFAVQVN